MSFELQKKNFLMRKDKSKKGSIDPFLRNFINKINKSQNYYSTSSCSGRTILLVRKKGKKHETEWVYVTHSIPNFRLVKRVISKYLKRKNKETVYFRFEPAIFHFCCKELEDAQSLVNISRNMGFRRSGIQSTNKKIVVEVSSSEIAESVIIKAGKLLVTDRYLSELIDEAKNKYKQNKNKIIKLEKLFPFQQPNKSSNH